MRYFTTTGIILRKQNSGENDYFLTIFSPEYGRIQAISKSSRKITSQKGNHLDSLNFCHFQFYKNGQNYLLTECRVENAFQSVKCDLSKSLHGITAAEIILKSIQSEEDNQKLFYLFFNYLNRLESFSQSQLILEEFKIKLLKLAGSWPEISLCHFCQTKWQSKDQIYYDQSGLLTCQNCLTFNQNQLTISDFSTIKLANFLAEHNLSDFKLNINTQELFNLQKITNIFLNNYLHQEIKTEKMLHSGNF